MHRLLTAVPLLLLLWGCATRSHTEEDERLIAAVSAGRWAAAPPPAAARPTALDMDAGEMLRAMGPLRYEASARFSYTSEAGEEAVLEETVTLVMAREGPFTLDVTKRFRRRDDPPGTSGRHAVYDGQAFYTRLEHGTWMVRDPLRQDHIQWRDEALQHLPVLLRLLGESVTREPTGQTLVLRLGEWKKPVLPEGMALTEALRTEGPAWYAGWGRIHRLERVEGTITLGPADAVVTAADLSVGARLRRRSRPRTVLSAPETGPVAPDLFHRRKEAAPGERPAEDGDGAAGATPGAAPAATEATFTATLRLSVRPLAAPPVIGPPPPESVRTPRRRRVHRMIQAILGSDS